MAEVVRRIIWITIVAIAISFALFLVVGNFLVAQAAHSGPVPVRDVVTSGTHELSGILVLPFSCDELSVQTEEVSATEYQLVFRTWQDPSVVCPQTPTPRPFQTVAFASTTGIIFSASIDGTPFPITVIPDTSTATSS